jgi:phosphonate transport system permease protein
MNSDSTEALTMSGLSTIPKPNRWALLKNAAIALVVLLVVAQAMVVVQARPEDLITGIGGMADIIRRGTPPDFSSFPDQIWPILETLDIALFGTAFGVILALPLAWLAARNTSPHPIIYHISRVFVATCRSVHELVWALIFVTAVGLGPFAGALALMVHSVGMLGRLLAETIEDMDMGPMEALASTGAGRLQIFSHAVVPTVLPSLLGITLYRMDDNIRSSLVLGFVGGGGIGFQLLTAMNLFDYRTVTLLVIVTAVIVIGTERISAWLRAKVT